MSVRLAILMDPIGAISYKKDSSLAMLWAASARGWELFYLEQADLELRDGVAFARLRPLQVHQDPAHWYDLGEPEWRPLGDMDVVLMRKDPPFDMGYIYTTYLLEQAERAGTLVVNRAASLRDCNEKLATAWFPELTVPSLVSRDKAELRAFVQRHEATILKPLGGMGGASIFKLTPGDANTSVVIETLTAHGQEWVMAQRFIPEISAGDKRILLIDGEPVPFALARIPASGEVRGNLAAGGRGEGIPLSENDYAICARIADEMRERGLLFVGIDVIGDYLTEINVTSPTCIRELDSQFGLDIAAELMEAIARKLERAA